MQGTIWQPGFIWSWRSRRRCRQNPGPLCSRSRIAPGGRGREGGRGVTVRTLFFFSFSAADLIFSPTYHSLNHVWPLHAQTLDRLKDVQKTFSFHSFQNVAERDEGAGPTRTGTETKNNVLEGVGGIFINARISLSQNTCSSFQTFYWRIVLIA